MQLGILKLFHHILLVKLNQKKIISTIIDEKSKEREFTFIKWNLKSHGLTWLPIQAITNFEYWNITAAAACFFSSVCKFVILIIRITSQKVENMDGKETYLKFMITHYFFIESAFIEKKWKNMKAEKTSPKSPFKERETCNSWRHMNGSVRTGNNLRHNTRDLMAVKWILDFLWLKGWCWIADRFKTSDRFI